MTTVGFITEADAMAHVHKVALDMAADFDANDETIIKRACDHAYKRIRAILTERGVAADAVTTWEDGASAQFSLTAYYALKDLLVAKSRELPPWLESFNVEAEIQNETLLASDGTVLAKGDKAAEAGRVFGVDLERLRHEQHGYDYFGGRHDD